MNYEAKTHENELINDMNIVIVGHVDHGKSTVIGRLLADTHVLPDGKLEQIKEQCRKNSKPFEYAFLLDALKDERAQGITIDSARCFFKTSKRRYMILDAPGHIEFLKNMITGASKAQAALLVVDAAEGIQENTKRHTYMLSLLGIKQIAVLINKMDLVDYSEQTFQAIVNDFKEFADELKMYARCFIPVSAMEGCNIATPSHEMPWYTGNTVLEALDSFESEGEKDALPFRMYVQDVYKFTLHHDDRRIIAGTVETGMLQNGDSVTFYPSGKTSVVKSIESFPSNPDITSAGPGTATGFTLETQLYIKRGELAVKNNEPSPLISSSFRANIFWLGKKPFQMDKTYSIKLGTNKAEIQLNKIVSLINSSTLEKLERNEVQANEVAECILKTNKPVAFDIADVFTTGRFVLVDEYDIAGGGLIYEAVYDEQKILRNQVLGREISWERSRISYEERSERYSQKPALVCVTGKSSYDKKIFAKALERRLFEKGRYVYYLGIRNIIHGLGADIEGSKFNSEYFRRLSETANIFLDAGILLIVTASDLERQDITRLRTIVDEEKIVMVAITDMPEDAELGYDLLIKPDSDIADAVYAIESYLKRNQFIFSL